MIKVNYTYHHRYKTPRVTDLVVTGHAFGSDQNILSTRVCAGVSAILVGSKMCFDFNHTTVIDKSGQFEVHIGSYADKQDYTVMDVILTQLSVIKDNYGKFFMKFEGKEKYAKKAKRQ